MFYDAGLLVLPFAALLASGQARVRHIVIVLWCAGFLDVAKEAIGLTPLFAVTIAAFVVAALGASTVDAVPVDETRAQRNPIGGSA
jgi:hypothetical protein